MRSRSTQRLSAGSPISISMPARSLRILVFVSCALITIVFLSWSHQNALDPEFPATFGVGRRTTEEHCAVPEAQERHPVDKFVQGFPKLRDLRARGVPEDIVRRAEREERKTIFDWPRVDKMFVFGDSYSTIDVDYRKTGVDGGHHERFHHKATDMKWADYLYAVFHDFHILQYYNFARPGAVIDPVIVPPGLEKYGTLQTQVKDFEDLFTPLPGPMRANWHGHDSLFVLFFGINDMGRMNREDLGRQDIPTTTRALAKSLVDSCRHLHSLGARSFLILNVPPLEHSPKYNLPGEAGIKSHDLIADSTSLFNQHLKLEVDKWDAEEGDKNLMVFDLESYWRLILAYPEVFGMTECSRYQLFLDEKRTNLGKMGYCYHDNQHISWSSAELLARAVHGFLLRHSDTFIGSNATESALHSSSNVT